MRYIRKDAFTKPRTAADILELALAKEKSSYKFYADLIEKTENPSLQRLLSELKSAEWGHIQRISRKLER
ncbi:MAG TPA: ferritin family protein [Candidatus Omnitrophota bacterium]|nr:ferritin family protein [Candidatus Omnitrophota bacterium]